MYSIRFSTSTIKLFCHPDHHIHAGDNSPFDITYKNKMFCHPDHHIQVIIHHSTLHLKIKMSGSSGKKRKIITSKIKGVSQLIVQLFAIIFSQNNVAQNFKGRKQSHRKRGLRTSTLNNS